MNYVYSTLSTPMQYTFYKNTPSNQPAVIFKSIKIKGGASIMDKRELHTPRGFVTQVTDEELELLKTNEVFKTHLENGFISFEERKEKSLDKKLETMTKRDFSAPKDKKYFYDRRKEAEKKAQKEGHDDFYAPMPNI